MKSNPLGVRITVIPELFIRPAPTGETQLVNIQGKSLGFYPSERSAKETAISIARRFSPTPRWYLKQYNKKLYTYNQLWKEIYE